MPRGERKAPKRRASAGAARRASRGASASGSAHGPPGDRRLEGAEEKEARLQAYLRLPLVGIAISSPEGRILQFNEALRSMLGYPPEDLLQRTLGDITFPDDRAAEMAELQRLLAGEVDGYTVTKRFIRVDGAVVWTALSASCVRGPDRRVDSIITVLKDVTAGKRVEEELRIHQQRLDFAVQSGRLGLWELDLATGRMWRTLQHDRLFGYDDLQPAWGEEEALRYVLPADQAALRHALAEAFASGRLHYAVRIRGPGDSAVRWIESDGKVVRDALGRPVRLAGVVMDVTEGKKAEQAVRDSERLYRAIGESIDYGVWVCAPDGRNTYASESFLKLVGMTQDQCSNFGWGNVLHPDDAERTIAAWQECVRTGGTWDIEHRFRGVDGAWHPVLARGVPVKDERGEVICWAGINLDVSRIRRAEQALRESQERLRLVLEGSDDGYWDWSIPAAVFVASRRMREILGLPGEGPESEAASDLWWKRVHSDDLPEVQRVVADFAAGRRPLLEAEYRLDHGDGLIRWVRVRGGVVARDESGRPVRAAGIATDVTRYRVMSEEREQALVALASSERMYRTIAHYFPNGLLALFDRDLRLVLVDGTRSLLVENPGTVVGKTPADFAPSELLPVIEGAYREALRGGTGTATLHHRGQTWEMITHPVRDEKGDIVMGMVMTQDVTARLAMETQLATSSRLAALGTLVAGVAHEINNPLASAIADGWLAIREIEEVLAALRSPGEVDRASAGARLEIALEALRDAQGDEQRISRIVKDLALFGRQDARRERVRLADVVEEALRWARTAVANAADIRVEAGQVPEVDAFSGQLGQVLVNLVTNAAQAIPEGRRGTITIRLGSGHGGTAVLEVSDDGRGIEPELIKRIFDPFFTTREVGKGMGLGLPICHAIVTAHGGTITATSEPGKGSTFRVEIPASKASAEEEAAPPAATRA
jgi:PAS domain S-box-containing protein